MLNNTLTWKHVFTNPQKSTHNAKKQTDVRAWQRNGVILLARSPAPKPLVAHGSGLQTGRLLAELDELGCGSAANLSRPQSCAKPRLDLRPQTRDLLSGPRSSTREQNHQKKFPRKYLKTTRAWDRMCSCAELHLAPPASRRLSTVQSCPVGCLCFLWTAQSRRYSPDVSRP